MNWIDLTIEDRRTILESLSVKLKLAPQSIEKDWWVTMVLKALFSSEFASHISFKGGTSLSKCFHLIDRFSEDVDIAIDREFLGFGGELSKTQVSDKLRRASCSFVREKLTTVIKLQLIELGISESEFEVKVNITSITTTDPEIIEIHYKSIYPNDTDYIRNKVLVEVSGRSMSDPIEAIEVRSMIAEALPKTKYADAKFKLMAVSPKRTFLEKACLLHEEFAQTTRAVRVDRMSRHLYDLERMISSGIADTALADEELYRAVIEHRRKFIGLKGFDYSELLPQNISFVLPADIRKAWQEDYKSMQESMIYGSSLDFDTLIERIIELNRRFNAMNL